MKTLLNIIWLVFGGLWLALGYFLAGGLDPVNVGSASTAAHAWGVDVSSGVEASRGVKDLAKIRAFVQAAKGAAPVKA